jgi:peptide/nickel transport system ATP-binding protein
MTATLQLINLTKSYQTPFFSKGKPRLALNGVSLRLTAGEKIGLVGASGSGKTTLALIALGLLAPTAGQVHLFGEDTHTWSRRKWRRSRARVQMLFQDPLIMLNPSRTVAQNLAESAQLHRADDPTDDIVSHILDVVGLSAKAGAYPRTLSGGEARRVSMARVLLSRPELVIVDEPTTGLDFAQKTRTLVTLFETLGPMCTVLFISHDTPLIQRFCTEYHELSAGQLSPRMRGVS